MPNKHQLAVKSPKHSVSYPHWATGLGSSVGASLPTPSTFPYTPKLAEEALVINVIAGLLALLALVLPTLLWTEAWSSRRRQ